MQRDLFRRSGLLAVRKEKKCNRRLILAGVVAATAAASSIFVMAAPAVAAPTGSTVANVSVGSAVTLSGLTPTFTLTGLPGDTADFSPVVFNVQTNNLAGYVVTVQSAAALMVPPDPGTNSDTIPIADLTVRETGGGAFTSLSDTTPVAVHAQPTRSALDGDSLSNDYQITVPDVNTDTYTATLDYVVTTAT